MSSTKLIVLKSKEIIYTLIFVALIILLIVILVIMFKPDSDDETNENTGSDTTEQNTDNDGEISSGDETTSDNSGTTEYIPGTYSSTITLGESTVSVMVTVDNESITDVSLKNLDESVTTMYPLLQSSIEDINTQLQYTLSIDDITYSSDTQYTTSILCKAIKNALEDAVAE